MDCFIRGSRKHGLTNETNKRSVRLWLDYLSYSNDRFCSNYGLTGKIQSDRWEGEFGIDSQSSEGNFHNSTYQVHNKLKLYRIKILNQLELLNKHQGSGIRECCKGVTHSKDDHEIIDSCYQISLQHILKGKICHSLNIWLCCFQIRMICLYS